MGLEEGSLKSIKFLTIKKMKTYHLPLFSLVFSKRITQPLLLLHFLLAIYQKFTKWKSLEILPFVTWGFILMNCCSRGGALVAFCGEYFSWVKGIVNIVQVLGDCLGFSRDCHWKVHCLFFQKFLFKLFLHVKPLQAGIFLCDVWKIRNKVVKFCVKEFPRQ